MDHTREQLDEHFMNSTLKDVKYMTGSKFHVFSDHQFQVDLLESHNRVRDQYGSPPLTWSQDLADQAQQWANKIAEKGILLYTELLGVGESIKFVPVYSDRMPTGDDVTQGWAGEAASYNYDKPSWNIDTKNFTQLVWKSTKEIGAGRAMIPRLNAVAVVAFYRPAGNSNYPGDFARNVSKLKPDLLTNPI